MTEHGDWNFLLQNLPYCGIFMLLGDGISRNQLIAAVHSADYPATDRSVRSVDVQILALRKKLGESGNLIETIRGGRVPVQGMTFYDVPYYDKCIYIINVPIKFVNLRFMRYRVMPNSL